MRRLHRISSKSRRYATHFRCRFRRTVRRSYMLILDARLRPSGTWNTFTITIELIKCCSTVPLSLPKDGLASRPRRRDME